MSDYSVGIKDILYAADIGNYAGSAPVSPATVFEIHISRLPAEPNTAIAILETGGKEPNPKWLVDYPSIQIIVRGAPNGYAAGKQKATDVKDALLGFTSADVNGDRWTCINMLGDINNLGYDSNNCPMWSLNFSLVICPAASSLTNRQPL